METAFLDFSNKLLGWYDANGRDLPWRIKNYGGMQNVAPNPYHIWLSEIMLQQTQVTTVKDYHAKFLKNWPTVQDLADAKQDDVLTAWAGLGYYARARNLHKCAQYICDEFDGEFPQNEYELLKLPGVGAYTAAAIASIAFNQAANVVDGNIERIFSRVEKLEKLFPAAKKDLYEIAQKYLPKARFGDYAQALMDLGATVCKPKKPKCDECPIWASCMMALDENVEKYPKKTPKKAKKQLKAHVFWVEKPNQRLVLMQKRPESGLLGNMMEFPSSEWIKDITDHNIGENIGNITHIFTHIKLKLTIWKIEEKAFEKSINDGLKVNLYSPQKWVSLNDFDKIAIPNLMQKVVALVEQQKNAPSLI